MDVEAIYDALLSHALASGLFDKVSGHEPKAAPPGTGLHAALYLDEIAPSPRRSGLAATSLRLAFNLRIGQDMLAEPQDDIDRAVLVATASMMSAYSGDFELGGDVAYVDLLGAHGPAMFAKAGYLRQDQKLFRVMVLTLPLIVDDVFTQSP